MLLQKLVLQHFRNRSSDIFELNPHLTIFLGENARGKTNILESIYFLINGTGFRESREEELLQIGKNEAYVEGRFGVGQDHRDFKIYITKRASLTEKIYFLERTRRHHPQYLEDQTKAILFAPEHIEIINGSPDIRRDYFNKVISFYDREYKKKLINLESALRRRNKIFERVHDDAKLHEELSFWNTYIEEQATYITQQRSEYVIYLNKHQRLDHKEFQMVYMKNEATVARFKELFEEEKRWRRTLIGPQKDEFQIIIRGEVPKNVHHYGARSEQRFAVFWLKMNEITYYEDTHHNKPILLLDDVFSEFDRQNKKLILNLIRKYQTVLTTTEEELVKRIDIPKTVIEV
jgi:DNA replication and repair protein RecF